MDFIDKVEIKLGNGRRINFFLQTWRVFLVETDCENIELGLDDESDELIFIRYDSIFDIERGAKILINYLDHDYPFIINKILVEEGRIYLAETERNISQRFIMPCLGLSYGAIGWPFLMNTYLFRDEEDCNSGTHMYLFYRKVVNEDFMRLRCELVRYPGFNEISFEDAEAVLFRFSFPLYFVPDVALLIQSRYSRISEACKRQIVGFYTCGNDTFLEAILYRHPEAIRMMENDLGIKVTPDMELFQKMNREKETWKT